MKNKILLFFIFLNFKSFSQKIFSADYSTQSDLKVFVTDYESQADLKVFKLAANTKNHKCDPQYLQKMSYDNEDIIKSRFAIYEKETLPILNYYTKKELLHQIDGMMEINEIYAQIRGIIDSIEA